MAVSVQFQPLISLPVPDANKNPSIQYLLLLVLDFRII